MQREKKKSYVYLTLSLLWMLIIFLFSQQTGKVSGDLSSSLTYRLLSFVYPSFFKLALAKQLSLLKTSHLIIRKIAHMSEYALLWLLWYQYFKSTNKRICHCFWLSLCICFFYACSDEWHQSFIPGRGPSFIDVLIDTSGALCCSGIYFFFSKYIKKVK